MSLSVLGGIGRGLQEGSQFVRQRRMDDATLDLRNQQLDLQRNQLAQQTKESDARLSMLNEEANWKRTDRGRAEAEAARQAEYGSLLSQTMQEMGPDADPLSVRITAGERWVKAGKAKPGELEEIMKANGEFRQRGLLQAFETGDLPTIEGLLAKQMKRNVRVTVQQTKDAFGFPDRIFTVVGDDGKPLSQLSESQLGFMMGVDRSTQKKTQAELAKTASEIGENNAQAVSARASAGASSAQAGKYKEEARQTQLENEGLSALDPKLRTTKASGSSETSEMKNARFMVQVGLAKTPAEAFTKLQQDKLLGETVRLMSNDVTAMRDPEGAFNRARAMVQAGGSEPTTGPVKVNSTEEAKALPKGTKFVAPDGKVRVVP